MVNEPKSDGPAADPGNGPEASPTERQSRRLFGWLRADTAAALAVGGLGLYVILRLPYAVYYARLGTTPEEVGLSYVDILGKSTLGVLTGLALSLVVALVIGFIVTNGEIMSAVDGLKNPAALIRGEPIPGSSRPRFVDLPLNNRILILRYIADQWQKDAPIFAHWIRSRPANWNPGSRKTISAPIWIVLRSQFQLTMRYFWAFASATLVIVCLVALPALGWFQADSVQHCTPSEIGKLALFEFRGDPASVQGIHPELPPSNPPRLFYLGTNGDKFIFYECKKHQTLTIESKDNITVSVGE